jgi:hypothetical protein
MGKKIQKTNNSRQNIYTKKKPLCDWVHNALLKLRRCTNKYQKNHGLGRLI